MKVTVKTLFILLVFFSINLMAQQTLTLEQCYQMALKNHPLSSKSSVLNKQYNWENQSLEAQKYPKVDLEAQASIQSDVISFPFSLPNIAVETPDKEQYKATLSVSQLIYNGGVIDKQQALKKLQLQSQEKEIEIQLHTLKTQINQLFYNILLTEEKNNILSNSIIQLKDKKGEIEKMIATGSLFESAIEPVEIKILELQQNIVEIESVKLQLVDQLGLLIGQEIKSDTKLSNLEILPFNQNPRTEFTLFELQKETVQIQENLLNSQKMPKILAFGTAGYGKPGLNMLENAFDDYYLAGVKLQWNVFDFQANKKKILANKQNLDLIENQKQVFEWNQKNSAKNYQNDILKYRSLLLSDVEIIKYRKKMVNTAEKQLKHDLITTSDYTAEINKLLEAEINQKSHEIQLQLAQSNYNITLFE